MHFVTLYRGGQRSAVIASPGKQSLRTVRLFESGIVSESCRRNRMDRDAIGSGSNAMRIPASALRCDLGATLTP